MSFNELQRELDIEFTSIQMSLDELESLLRDIADREPSIRELAAAGLFLANFYNGIENVLKRISRFNGIEIPTGENWHAELTRMFSDPPRGDLPLLLDSQLANDLSPYRQFRHVIHHGYGFRLRWPDLLPGVEGARNVFARFKAAVEQYLRDAQTESKTPRVTKPGK